MITSLKYLARSYFQTASYEFGVALQHCSYKHFAKTNIINKKKSNQMVTLIYNETK